MNAITVIHPYKFNGMWVFDDADKELVKEPFVAGADNIIERLSKAIPNAEAGFNLIFSSEPFPGFTVKLVWLAPVHTGNLYHCEELNTDGWLCPALLKYFETAPKRIYAQFKSN